MTAVLEVWKQNCWTNHRSNLYNVLLDYFYGRRFQRNPLCPLVLSLSEFANMHPFQPNDQCEGYREMIDTLDAALCEITQFAAVSTQPNSGAAGEYAGLVAITRYLQSIGQGERNVCLIPKSPVANARLKPFSMVVDFTILYMFVRLIMLP